MNFSSRSLTANEIAVKINNHELVIRAEWRGEKLPIWSTNTADYNRHNVVTVELDGGESFEFDFWASSVDPEVSGEKSILEAFGMFLSDAECALMSPFEFMREMGFEDPARAEQVYNACMEELHHAERIVSRDVIPELINAVNDYVEDMED